MTPLVRIAEMDDVNSIAKVHVKAWKKAYIGVMPEQYLDFLTIQNRIPMWEKALSSDEPGTYIVSELSNEIEGFAVFGPARDKDLSNLRAGELVALNVNPDAWGLGVGGSLIDYVIRISGDAKWESLHLWVVESNSWAIKLYEKREFYAKERERRIEQMY